MDNYVIRLPDIGEGVAEAEIVAWHIGVGDRLEEDQATVDVMTDKATVEMTTPVAGVVVALHGEVGQMMPVGSPLIELALDAQGADPDPDADPASVMDGPETPTLPETIATPDTPAVTPAPEPAPEETPAAASVEAPLAAPATRRRARELGIVLQDVPGTGPDGRVTPDDLDGFVARTAAKPVAPSPVPVAQTGINEVRIIGLRRRIAEKMQESTRRIPHFGYVEEFDLTELEALRRALNDERSDGQPRLTLLPFFMRAIVRLAPQFPSMNARYDDDAGILLTYDAVHLGIATQTDAGLLVPVVRHAETLDIWQSASALERVTQAARDGSATRDELAGSTITLTSLGKLGGVSATPVINHPEVAIIGPNKLMDRPVVIGGQITIRTMMNVSSSFDHRIVDGYDAARFIQALKRLIECPALLFVVAARTSSAGT